MDSAIGAPSGQALLLVGSGTTETFQPGELRKEVEGYSDLMIEALQKRNLLAK